MKKYLVFWCLLTVYIPVKAQLFINEGSNKNYSTITDEDGEYEDWIELYNAAAVPIDLYNYSLTDRSSMPAQWTFPHSMLPAGAYKVIYCSGKNRMETLPFTAVVNDAGFIPQQNWNTHNLNSPFYWDGVSSLVINICSYSGSGYTANSIFRQSATPYSSSLAAFEDYSAASCAAITGTTYNQRPNMKLNGLTIGTGNIQNGATDYPAPYGNWYWSARHQLLIPASELIAAGLTAGNITTLAFDVVTPDPCVYDYIDISMNLSNLSSLSNNFIPPGGNNFHTNFKISSNGELIQLYNPSGNIQSSLFVNCPATDVSIGLLPDASINTAFFLPATPAATNNGSAGLAAPALPPAFSMASGILSAPANIIINNPNGPGSEVRYTIDGSDPSPASVLYDSTPIFVFQNTVLKARVFVPGSIPSTVVGASYLLNISHQTPILSLYTDNANLYGANGNFDHPYNDWLKSVQVDYFDAAPAHNLVFSQHSGMIQDGGAGGSRGNPQRSFRLELDHNVVGDGPVQETLIERRPNRNKFSKLYFRNGSNQFLAFPHKDAAQVAMMADETNNYYSAMQPVSVYINGRYFGLYEMREKFDEEYFNEYDNAVESTVDIMSLSYYYNSILRSVEGDPVDSFFTAYNELKALNPADTAYWSQADRYFDMQYYNDYIIAESWMPNTDWPQNNIKIYRSNATGNRFRFCLIDLELSMNPNGWTDCEFDHIDYMLNYNSANPYINIWQHGLQNNRFRDYFINRFADLMNTSYDTSRLRQINRDMFNEMVVEMPNEYARWGNGNIQQQMNDFYQNYLTFDSQLICRSAEVRDDIQSGFNLAQQVDISLDVFPAAAGNVKISTVTPETYPLTWVYFDGLPVKIEAMANPGYRFSHWENNPLITDTLNPVFRDTLNANLLFRAHFEEIPNYVPLVEDFERNFTLFPNPAESRITLKSENPNLLNNAIYQIVAVDGRILEKGALSAESINEFSIGHFPPGLYFFKITDSGSAVNRLIKFVKMN